MSTTILSADSRTVFFQSNGKLRKVDVNGGLVQPVCDFNAALPGGFLTADNRIVFGTPTANGIQESAAGSGAARSLTSFQRGLQET